MANNKLLVIVLAAGHGTRMHSSLPKVCHPLGGKPLLAYVLETAYSLNPAKIIPVIAPNMDACEEVIKQCSKDWDISVEITIQDPAQGTGHAVLAAKDHLKDFAGDILVLCGDTPLLTVDTLNKIIADKHQSKAPAIVVLGMRPNDEGQYARIVTNSIGEVERIVEHAEASNEQLQNPLCNSGVMLIDGAIALSLLEQITCDNVKNEYYLTDIVKLAQANELEVHCVEGAADELLGINSQQDLANAERVLQNRWRQAVMEKGVTLTDPNSVFFSYDTQVSQDVTIAPNVVFGPRVSIKAGVTIKPFCKIEGAVIKSGATIGPFAHIRPGSDIGNNAEIGNFVEIKQSNIHEGAKIKHLSYIGDSDIGAQTNIGAGTITCNYDGFHKHRTSIGKQVNIGANTSLVAPVEIGDKALIGAGSVVTDDVPIDALAITRAPQQAISGGASKYRRKRSQLKIVKNKGD